MKPILSFINEALRVKGGAKVATGTKKTEFPETKEELINIIQGIVKSRDKASKDLINLNHIDVSKITDFKGLFSWGNRNPSLMRKITNGSISPGFYFNRMHNYKLSWSIFYSLDDYTLGELKFDFSEWDMSNATEVDFMFAGYDVECDISNWNLSNVEFMTGMFAQGNVYCDISKWNVSKVRDMSLLFYYSDFDGDISKWDVSNVECMVGTFCFSGFDGDISKWNVSKVKGMGYMFRRSYFDGDISNWDVSSVTDFTSMFSGSEFNQDISKWNVSAAKSFRRMFKKSSFDGDISDWDVSTAYSMENMFYESEFTGKNGDIGKWKLKSIENVDEMFSKSNLELSLEGWKHYLMKDFRACKCRFMFNEMKNPNFKEPKWFRICLRAIKLDN